MLSVLGYEGPQLRAYLLFLKANGFRVDKLYMIAPTRDISSNRKIYSLLPTYHRARLRTRQLGSRMNYWAKYIRFRNEELYKSVTSTMAEVYDFDVSLYHSMTTKVDWQDYADKVVYFEVDSLKDARLKSQLLAHQVQGALLYTGGGIVPANLLSIEGLRFIHFHPGYLPDVRGADGLLWSVLLNGRPGISGFYMEAGLDTGAVVFARHEPELNFKCDVSNIVPLNLYRAIFAFVDPIIRARALCDCLKENMVDASEIPETAQDLGEGETYHFMHETLRNEVLKRIFRNP